MEAGSLRAIVYSPIGMIFKISAPVTDKVTDFAENYFKEITWLFGTIMIFSINPRWGLGGMVFGLISPISNEKSQYEDIDDSDKPVRYRFAAQVLFGAGAAIAGTVFPHFYLMKGASAIGAIGIGVVLNRLYESFKN